jgi:polyhydroxyalkanoate synthesis regulator phasin
MKTKTLLELITLASSVYYLARDTQIIERINELSEKGKDNINFFASEPVLDEDGNEMEFADKLLYKTAQFKDEIEEKIEELVAKFYKKVNIAHLDEIRALNEKLDQADRAIALMEARLNKIEANG